MRRPGSEGGPAGWIYGYEIIGKDSTDTTDVLRDVEPPVENSNADVVEIKVGYTTGLTRRLADWRHCVGSPPALLGFWPRETDDDITSAHLQVGLPGPYAAMLEKLVHIELTDLAVNAPYLVTTSGTTSRGLRRGPRVFRRRCPKCGSSTNE